MTEPDFHDLRSGLRAGDISPDSVTFTAETSRLAELELSEVLQSGPDPIPNKSTLVQKNSIISLRSQEKAKDDSETETTEDESIAIDSARSSFSQALKECQDRRLRSGVMKKTSAATCRIATIPSPRTPNQQHMNVGIQKGSNCDRTPLNSNPNGRKVNTALLLAYNNGKALPSKWEDAERWICSPASGDGAVRTFQQPQPKSKSGPLGHPGIAYYQLFSPAGGGNKLAANYLCSSAVDGLSTQCGGCERSGNFVIGTEPCMARSISIHGCSEMKPRQSLLPVHQDGAFSRRDIATQISPRRHPLFCPTTPSIQPIVELPSMSPSKPEIRDVLVDKRVTMTRWSKKNWNRTRGSWSSRSNADWKMKGIDIHTAGWEVPIQTSKSISKIQKEEAKISAWENLQRVEAEAAIRKLEMKLEKKRSSSMEKIMNKLRSAQKKAQEMRGSTVTTNQGAAHQTARPFVAALSFRKTRQFGCFMCNAF